MSDLLPYNLKFVPKGNGFVNLGATCYFNSILQCLMSCSSIFETLKANEDKDHIKNHPLARNLMALHRASMMGQDVSRACIPVWRDIMGIAQARNDKVKINMGQQDAHEGLMMFLDIVDTIPEIKRLFEHRHRTQVLCDKCKKWVVDRKETNLTFDVQPDLKTEQHIKFYAIDEHYNTTMSLNNFLRKQNGFIDENYICPNESCKQRGHKFKTTTLTMSPEILPVLIKKYSRVKTVTPFPGTLEFVLIGGKQKLIYRLVAQSEHSGSMTGGHYWAIGLRSDGWKNLNDSSVNPGIPGPTSNSYVLFYHYVATVDVVSENVMVAVDPLVVPTLSSSSSATVLDYNNTIA
jgi:ubiquitin C-terminal hydrolase